MSAGVSEEAIFFWRVKRDICSIYSARVTGRWLEAAVGVQSRSVTRFRDQEHFDLG